MQEFVFLISIWYRANLGIIGLDPISLHTIFPKTEFLAIF